MNKKVAVLWLVLTLGVSFVVIIVEIPTNVSAPTIYVDDDNTGFEDGSQANPWNTIQEGVDAANPGDTVFVSNGTYYEDVYINKTINLTGISRDNTTINATNLIGIYVENADYVNISGFTVVNGSWAGIRLMPSNNSIVENNRVEMNSDGIQVIESNNTIIRNNIVLNNTDDGIYLGRSTNVTVENNTCFNNDHDGIYIYQDNYYNKIIGNNCSYNGHGIYLTTDSDNNFLKDNVVISNDGPTLSQSGLTIAFSDSNVIINLTCLNNKYGLVMTSGLPDTITNYVINSTILNSINDNIWIGPESHGIFLNSTFDNNDIYYWDTISTLTNQWYLHVNVIDNLGNPVPIANVKIDDNLNGSYNQTFITNPSGFVKWLPIIEYIEQDTTGDTLGEKTYYTPHRIIAWNDTLTGYAYPEPNVNESKMITIVLYNGTRLDLEPGWNLISLPRPQSDTNLETVLQSIESHYNAVQWYNVTDNTDPWKHYHISKPSNLNDLDEINHTMGLWVHITDPGGTTLVVFGDVLTSTQNITLYPGWNLVGFTSLSIKNRTEALNNINFTNDLDAIWTYNATTQKWKEITASDNFEIGRGYWIHAKVTKTWIVPL